MRIVVVGANGGIGSQVCYLLRVAQHEVLECRLPRDLIGKADAWVFAQGSHKDCFHANYGLVDRWLKEAPAPDIVVSMCGGGVGGSPSLDVPRDYVASKAALAVWTEWVALTYRTQQFFCVAPGLTATKMTGYKGADPRIPAAFIVKLLSGKYGHLSGSLLAAQRDDLDTMKPMKLRRVEA